MNYLPSNILDISCGRRIDSLWREGGDSDVSTRSKVKWEEILKIGWDSSGLDLITYPEPYVPGHSGVASQRGDEDGGERINPERLSVIFRIYLYSMFKSAKSVNAEKASGIYKDMVLRWSSEFSPEIINEITNRAVLPITLVDVKREVKIGAIDDKNIDQKALKLYLKQLKKFYSVWVGNESGGVAKVRKFRRDVCGRIFGTSTYRPFMIEYPSPFAEQGHGIHCSARGVSLADQIERRGEMAIVRSKLPSVHTPLSLTISSITFQFSHGGVALFDRIVCSKNVLYASYNPLVSETNLPNVMYKVYKGTIASDTEYYNEFITNGIVSRGRVIMGLVVPITPLHIYSTIKKPPLALLVVDEDGVGRISFTVPVHHVTIPHARRIIDTIRKVCTFSSIYEVESVSSGEVDCRFVSISASCNFISEVYPKGDNPRVFHSDIIRDVISNTVFGSSICFLNESSERFKDKNSDIYLGDGKDGETDNSIVKKMDTVSTRFMPNWDTFDSSSVRTLSSPLVGAGEGGVEDDIFSGSFQGGGTEDKVSSGFKVSAYSNCVSISQEDGREFYKRFMTFRRDGIGSDIVTPDELYSYFTGTLPDVEKERRKGWMYYSTTINKTEVTDMMWFEYVGAVYRSLMAYAFDYTDCMFRNLRNVVPSVLNDAAPLAPIPALLRYVKPKRGESSPRIEIKELYVNRKRGKVRLGGDHVKTVKDLFPYIYVQHIATCTTGGNYTTTPYFITSLSRDTATTTFNKSGVKIDPGVCVDIALSIPADTSGATLLNLTDAAGSGSTGTKKGKGRKNKMIGVYKNPITCEWIIFTYTHSNMPTVSAKKHILFSNFDDIHIREMNHFCTLAKQKKTTGKEAGGIIVKGKKPTKEGGSSFLPVEMCVVRLDDMPQASTQKIIDYLFLNGTGKGPIYRRKGIPHTDESFLKSLSVCMGAGLSRVKDRIRAFLSRGKGVFARQVQRPEEAIPLLSQIFGVRIYLFELDGTINSPCVYVPPFAYRGVVYPITNATTTQDGGESRVYVIIRVKRIKYFSSCPDDQEEWLSSLRDVEYQYEPVYATGNKTRGSRVEFNMNKDVVIPSSGEKQVYNYAKVCEWIHSTLDSGLVI